MGLETFAFIPDLVATNPEPTDPVAQGDDHIRGLKFTLQNQWPNIGEDQVDRTALQMNDAALRSEQNIFSANLNQFTDSALRITQSADTESGKLLFIAEDAVQRWNIGRGPSASAGNFELRRFDSAGNLLDAPIAVNAALGNIDYSGRQRGPGGTAGNPTWSFTGDNVKGLYSIDVDRLGISVNSVLQQELNTQNAIFAQPVLFPDGSAANPAMAFSTSPSTGFSKPSSGVVALSISGAETWRSSTTAFTNNFQFRNQAGSQGAPAYSFGGDTDSGMWSSGANEVTIGTLALPGLTVSAGQTTTVRKEGTITRNNDTQARTGWRYTNVANQPMWSIYLGTSPGNVLSFQRYSDTGTFLDIPFQLNQERGTVRMATLPTSSAGLVAGDCWRNPVSPGFVAII